MALSIRQKKSIMQELIQTHYADKLLNAGFVSYKEEGFHWYKSDKELLYTVRLPVFSPRSPLTLDIGFGVIPLFTWEHIAPNGFSRDYSAEFHDGRDHVNRSRTYYIQEEYEKIIGKLPRNWASCRVIAHYVPEGSEDSVLIEHPDTPGCGSEILEEMVFPFFYKMDSLSAIYKWNKARKIASVMSRMGINKELKLDDPSTFALVMSQCFADECLYLRDESMYQAILIYMKERNETVPRWEGRMLRLNRRPYQSEEEKIEAELDCEHRRVLIEALEERDFDRIDDQLELTRQRMLEQIKRKLPKLQVN